MATAPDQSVVVGVTVVGTVVVLALLIAVVASIRAARQLRRAAAELRRETILLVDEVGGTVAHANAELERVDDLIGSAESITDTVGSASRLAYLTVANPLIKVLALSRGTSRASARLRSGRRPSQEPARRARR
ncbi:MAG: hypothetical protein ACRDXE_02775 [Acidimicrobiales bacterium]